MGSPPAGFARPFKYDGMNYVWDANGKMAADFNGPGSSWFVGCIKAESLRPRGWGRISYLPDSSDLMDQWAGWLARVTGGSNDPDTVIKRMNGGE